MGSEEKDRLELGSAAAHLVVVKRIGNEEALG
jgi:hypothetical protein